MERSGFDRVEWPASDGGVQRVAVIDIDWREL